VTAAALRPPRSLAVPLSASLALHVIAVAVAIQIRTAERVSPPVYAVTLIAAPAGAPAIGVVNPPKAAEQPKAPPPKVREAPQTKSVPTRRTPAVTRVTPTEARPLTKADRRPEQTAAGGGPVGGTGTDVANVSIDGREFPFPSYLQNIVTQIRLRFGRQSWPEAATAEFSFLIMRDGSIKFLKLREAKGASFEFRLEAESAIESAGRVKAFGPLPDGFADDALPVVFSFDPRIIR
jgi:hypothetical protein